MIKTTNDVTIEGYLYEHKLELKTTGPNSKKLWLMVRTVRLS